MSGLPNYEDVKRFRDLAEKLVNVSESIDYCERTIDQESRKLENFRKASTEYRQAMLALLEKMDVQSSGNTGFEKRLLAFHIELQKQHSSELNSTRAVPVEGD